MSESVPYPVNFIENVGFHDNAAHHTSSGGNLHLDLDTAEEEVVLGVDGRGITLLVDGEGRTLVVESHIASGGLPTFESALTLGEVGFESGRFHAIIRGASFYLISFIQCLGT